MSVKELEKQSEATSEVVNVGTTDLGTVTLAQLHQRVDSLLARANRFAELAKQELPRQLRPTPEHAGQRWHYVKALDSNRRERWEWTGGDGGGWVFATIAGPDGYTYGHTGLEAAYQDGWRYVGPVDAAYAAAPETAQEPVRQAPDADQNAKAAKLVADPVFWVDARKVDTAAAPAELRPPPEHEGKALHWVHNHKGADTVAYWCRGDERWVPLGCSFPVSGLELYERGYRYLGPAEWREPDELRAGHRWHWLDTRIGDLEAENARLEALAAEHNAEILRLAKGNAIKQDMIDKLSAQLQLRADQVTALQAMAKVRSEAFVAVTELLAEAENSIAMLVAENTELRDAS